MTFGEAENRTPRWKRWPSRLRRWLLSATPDDGAGMPPNAVRSITILVSEGERHGRTQTHEVYAYFLNDAFDIWIGETYTDGDAKNESWKFDCRTETFRKMALWYLWRWAWGEWFGLRRKLFYWDLHRRVSKWRGHLKEEGTADD
jgi:hypothetical protein